KIGSVRQAFFAGRLDVFPDPPQQVRTRSGRLLPHLKPEKAAVCQAQHALAETGQYSLCQGDFAGGVVRHPAAEKDMGAVLHQRYEADLWIRALAATGSRPPERFVVAFLVGDIQSAAVNANQMPRSIPCAVGRCSR